MRLKRREFFRGLSLVTLWIAGQKVFANTVPQKLFSNRRENQFYQLSQHLTGLKTLDSSSSQLILRAHDHIFSYSAVEGALKHFEKV